MNVLITGAAGFLGYHLARELAGRSGYRIICVDNGERGEFDGYYRRLADASNVEEYCVDLSDRTDVERLPTEIDVIFHLAALNGTQNFYERPFDVVRCCTLPTLNLIAKYGPHGCVRRFVYAGSSESYASTVTQFGWEVPTSEGVPLCIDDVRNTRWSYGAGKMLGEVAAFASESQHGMSATVLRYHNVYGPRMGDKHVVPDFYMRARSGNLALYGYDHTRAFLYVDDAIRATVLAGFSENTRSEVINVGSEREITIKDLGEKMKEVGGLTGEVALYPGPTGSVKRRCPDIKKLRNLTGFEEEWSLEEGLAETARFYL